jgi:hypothetical protein
MVSSWQEISTETGHFMGTRPGNRLKNNRNVSSGERKHRCGGIVFSPNGRFHMAVCQHQWISIRPGIDSDFSFAIDQILIHGF